MDRYAVWRKQFFPRIFSKNKLNLKDIQSSGNVSQAKRNERERQVIVKSHAETPAKRETIEKESERSRRWQN